MSTTLPSGSGGGRPKGKDFASMSAHQQQKTTSPPLPLQQQPEQASQQVAPSRPKGKDFTRMSAGASVQLHTSPPASTPQTFEQPPIQQPPLSNSQPVATTGGKPKGKDFSAMASRMGVSPTATQTQPQAKPPTQSQIDEARAAQMRAAARAAAGLPPIEQHTESSVSVMPASVGQYGTVPTHNRDQQVQMSSHSARSQSYNGSSYNIPVAQQQPQPHTYPTQQQAYGNYNLPPPQVVTHRSSSMGSEGAGGVNTSRPVSSSAARRLSQTGAPNNSSIATDKVVKAQPAPTPSPTVAEARVSMMTATHLVPLVGPRIQELVKSLDPAYTIDPQAEEQVLQLADDFLEKVCKQAFRLAAHRGSKTLDVQDVQLVLAKQWGISIPGLGPLIPKKPKVGAATTLLSGKSGGTTTTSTNTSGMKRKANSTTGQSDSKANKSASETAMTGTGVVGEK